MDLIQKLVGVVFTVILPLLVMFGLLSLAPFLYRKVYPYFAASQKRAQERNNQALACEKAANAGMAKKHAKQ